MSKTVSDATREGYDRYVAEKDRKYLRQRYDAMCLWAGGEARLKSIFNYERLEDVMTQWILDMMEYILSGREVRQRTYGEFVRSLRRLDSISIYAQCPNLSNREKKLKEIFGKYSRGVKYSDLIEEYGSNLVESMCEMFNMRKG